MKRTQQCPKCQGRRLWLIEPFRVPSEVAAGQTLPVLTHQPQPGGLFAIARANPQGRFDLWVCDACGYCELWASGLSGLRHDPAAGVRLVDTTAEPSGPFR